MVRDTNAPAATVALVRARDGGQCVGCGTTRDLTTQHRASRQMGGTRRREIHRVSNLLTMCWTLSPLGCHPWAEGHPLEAREKGWALRAGDSSLEVPVLWFDGTLRWLDDDGGFSLIEWPKRPAQPPVIDAGWVDQ